MANTTNFNWETPDDTDLVKDGAAAMRTLGNSIDTSFVDLKGGTTGQVLAKASSADLDFVWSADAAGMTNPMTTTGDTIYSSSGSTPARLGIGTTGQVLTVSGGLPAWATGPGAYTLLASGNFSTGSATLALTGIPATYEELYVVLRDVAPSAAPAQIQMRLNNDSSGLYGDTTTNPLSSLSTMALTFMRITGGRNVFNTGVDNLQVIRIPDYANTNAFKLLTNSYLVQEDATNWSGGLTSGFYRSTTAISQINFLNSTAANWASGSYELFGVK